MERFNQTENLNFHKCSEFTGLKNSSCDHSFADSGDEAEREVGDAY